MNNTIKLPIIGWEVSKNDGSKPMFFINDSSIMVKLIENMEKQGKGLTIIEYVNKSQTNETQNPKEEKYW